MSQAIPLEFSHVGLFVIDLDKMADFYHRVLGFPITDRGLLGEAELVFLSRNPRDHHQIVLVAGRPPGLPDRIVNQVSFRVESLARLRQFHQRVRAEGVADLVPILHGNAWSVYFRDPEGNRLEVFVDTDWYITQPFREIIDLDLPEAEIRRLTEERCQGRPGFKPIAEWRAEIAREMADQES